MAASTRTKPADVEVPAPVEIPTETRLDSDVSKPSTTAPGDGPADTTDPTERATSVPVSPGLSAILAGTVNAVIPVPETDEQRDAREAKAASGEPRIETYPSYLADGSKVIVEHNLETGDTKIIG